MSAFSPGVYVPPLVSMGIERLVPSMTPQPSLMRGMGAAGAAPPEARTPATETRCPFARLCASLVTSLTY